MLDMMNMKLNLKVLKAYARILKVIKSQIRTNRTKKKR